MGLEWGIDSRVPIWTSLNKWPASIRATVESGGVLISPCSHTRGFPAGFGIDYMSELTLCQEGSKGGARNAEKVYTSNAV